MSERDSVPLFQPERWFPSSTSGHSLPAAKTGSLLLNSALLEFFFTALVTTCNFITTCSFAHCVSTPLEHIREDVGFVSVLTAVFREPRISNAQHIISAQ